AASARPLMALALANTAALPRNPLRESMIILLVQCLPVSADGSLVGLGAPVLSPDMPPPTVAALTFTVASRKSLLASIADIVAAMRRRASASSENTSISMAL